MTYILLIQIIRVLIKVALITCTVNMETTPNSYKVFIKIVMSHLTICDYWSAL